MCVVSLLHFGAGVICRVMFGHGTQKYMHRLRTVGLSVMDNGRLAAGMASRGLCDGRGCESGGKSQERSKAENLHGNSLFLAVHLKMQRTSGSLWSSREARGSPERQKEMGSVRYQQWQRLSPSCAFVLPCHTTSTLALLPDPALALRTADSREGKVRHHANTHTKAGANRVPVEC